MRAGIGLCLSMTIAWLLLIPRLARRTAYYVSPNGSDHATGTFAQPFQTIQKAANTAVAGDTVYIRGGVYRETVTPKRSGTAKKPIRFLPYGAEPVTISGADVIPAESWTRYNGNIYRAPMGWDRGDDANQVFLDGRMMIEAQWPNTTLDITRPTPAHAASGTAEGAGATRNGAIVDPILPDRPAGYWNGAKLHICLGACWTWSRFLVTDSSRPGQLSFPFTFADKALLPSEQNPYFLTGKLAELDSPGEWFRDSRTGTLYFWTPGSDHPSQHVVEAKRRLLAFDLSGRSFITIQGFTLFAAGIDTDSKSEYLVLDGLRGLYLSHEALPLGQLAYFGASNAGISLRGRNNILRNSVLAFSSGSGVRLEGTGQRVFNNVIRGADYRPTYASPVFAGVDAVQQNGHLIAYNTVSDSARFGIYHSDHFGTGRIVHNEIYDFGLQTNDVGCTYTWGADGRGTEIAYNRCHDGHGLLLPPEREVFAVGIYLDNGCSNFVVHHNAVWNIQWAININDPNTNDQIYNNTLIGTGSSFHPKGNDHLNGSRIRNNIFVGPIHAKILGADFSHNLVPGTNPQFMDPAMHDFRLRPGSPAIGTGAIIPPYTDGYHGSAPDIGAYDHASLPWKAGIQSTALVEAATLAPGDLAVVDGPIPFDSGVSVQLTDGANADIPAQVVQVQASPPRLSFRVPSNARTGIVLITITNGSGEVSLASVPLLAVTKRPGR